MGSAFSQQQYVVAKPPTGRLTLTTGTPVMSAEAANQQTIYYTPYVGAMVPIYDGTGWRERTFAELSLALAGSANWASGSNYDLFVVDDGGTLRLLTGPAWTNDTTRSTAISRLNGLWVNDASMTGRYGASSTMTVGQYRGLYVGTVRMNASGQTTWELGGTAAGGDPGNLFLWNCYNRVEASAASSDSTASWSYNSTTVRSKNASTSNRVSFVRGLNEDIVRAFNFISGSDGAASDLSVAVGLDSTSAITGSPAYYAPANVGQINELSVSLEIAAGLGFHYVQALEYQATTVTAATFYGATDRFSLSGHF